MEATLVQSSNKRTLIVTLGAVLATVVVFGGVFLGPNIVQCVQSEDGFGACLSTALVERGLIDKNEGEFVAQDESLEPAPEAGTSSDNIAATDTVEDASNPPIGARVEPDGATILVGTADANAVVQLFANGKPLGQTTADSVGDWIFIPDNPITPGGVEITVGTMEAEGELTFLDDTLVVVIQEDLTSEPLVVAGKAGETSDILEDLFGPDANVPALDTSAIEVAQTASPDEETAVEPPLEVAALESAPEIPAVEEGAPLLPEAGASQQTDGQSVPEVTAQNAAPRAAETEPAPTEDVVEEEAATEQLSTEVSTTEQQGDIPLTASGGTVEEPATAPTLEPANEPVPEAQEPVAMTPQSAEAQPAQVVPVPAEVEQVDQQPADNANGEPLAEDAPLEVAAISPEQLIVETPTAFVPPSIDAIEIEAGRNYIAGSGQNGATVRLYVDNVHVGDSVVQGGRWLVEAENILTKPSQRIRADMLVANTGQVAARSEINFVIEKPDPVSVAQAQRAAPGETPPPAPVADIVLSAEQLAPAVLPTSAPPVGAPPVEVVAEAPAPEAVEATDFTLPAEQLAPIALPTQAPAIVVAQVEQALIQEPPLETGDESIPTLVAVAVGDPEDQRFVSGKAIIRRGDNLWTIARRVYGTGVSYTMIFDANKSQIRDPNLIYPGQVFDLPEDSQEQGQAE